MDSHIYNVSGGGLPGVYTTVQLHLHWGSNNSRGSEHTMDGMMYPAEVCYVRCYICGSVKLCIMKVITLVKAETIARKNASMCLSRNWVLLRSTFVE